jgi:septal ring factor EnvC (AmiA/AmiB activator)
LPLCDAHVILHQKNKNTKDHSLIPVDQVSKDQLSKIKKPSPRCSKHRGEKLKFLCQCDELICGDCAVTDHDGHKKTHIDTAANQERVNLKQLIMQTQKDVNHVEKSLSEVIEMMQKIEKKCENECKKVEQEAKKLKEHIDQRATKLLNEIKDLKKMKLKNLELQKEHLSQMITTAKIDDIAFVDHSDNIELLNLKN